MTFQNSRISIFRPIESLFHHGGTQQTQGETLTTPTPIPAQPAPPATVIATAAVAAPVAAAPVAAAPVAAAPSTATHSNLAASILNDALAAGMIAISLFVKNPTTQQHAATLITAFTPLLGLIEAQLGIAPTTPAQ